MSSVSAAESEKQAQRYKALLRLSGSLASGLPDDLARSLAQELHGILSFDFLDVLVFKEGTPEVLWKVVAEGETPSLSIPMEKTGCARDQ